MPIHFLKFIKSQQADKFIRLPASVKANGPIEGVYLFDGDRVQSRQLLFNDGFPAVVFMPAKESTSKVDVNGMAFSVGAVWACGGIVKKTYWEVEAMKGEVFIVRFHPFSFFTLFDVNADCFQRQPVMDFSEILGSAYPAFVESFYQCINAREKVKFIERFIAAGKAVPTCPALLLEGMHYIDRNRGALSVKALNNAFKIMVNYKWWERNFKRYVGLSPQHYILLQRFLHAYMELEATPHKKLLEVALNNGYCDENHLLKDFRQYCGKPPGSYFRETGATGRVLYVAE